MANRIFKMCMVLTSILPLFSCDKDEDKDVPLNWNTFLGYTPNLFGISVDGKVGFIDNTGKIVITPQFDFVGDFWFDLAVYGEYEEGNGGNKYGYFDKTGNKVIPANFHEAQNFGINKLAAVMNEDEEFGYINRSGELVIPYQYQYADLFNDGLAPVKKDGLYGYIDVTGKMVINPAYNYGSIFVNDIAYVRNNEIGRAHV